MTQDALTPFEIVPGVDADFNYGHLVDQMPTARLVTATSHPSFVYVKIDTWGVLFVLNALKEALGRDAFNARVGLRRWDVGLVMIDVVPLDDAELIKGLVKLKELLTLSGITPDQKFNQHRIDICIADLCVLNRRISNLMPHSAAYILPDWEEIAPGMTLRS